MPSLRDDLRRDFAKNKDGLTRSVLLVFRFGQWTHRKRGLVGGLLAIPYKVANLLWLRIGRGCDLPRELQCGPGLRLHHAGKGVDVHRRAVLGNDVTLFQGVAIGQRDQTGEPRIGDRVLVGAGAAILGPVQVGDDALVGAHALVLDDVPAGGKALGHRAIIRA